MIPSTWSGVVTLLWLLQSTCQAASSAALNSAPIGHPSSAPTRTYVVLIRYRGAAPVKSMAMICM